jgi:hypothetical protein
VWLWTADSWPLVLLYGLAVWGAAAAAVWATRAQWHSAPDRATSWPGAHWLVLGATSAVWAKLAFGAIYGMPSLLSLGQTHGASATAHTLLASCELTGLAVAATAMLPLARGMGGGAKRGAAQDAMAVAIVVAPALLWAVSATTAAWRRDYEPGCAFGNPRSWEVWWYAGWAVCYAQSAAAVVRQARGEQPPAGPKQP